MIPGGMDPKKMQAIMKQMGIKSEEIAATKVIIETEAGSALIIENPQVTQITMQGQRSFQIAGDVRTESRVSQDDVKLVMEKAGCSEEAARSALEKSEGDIAEAILALSGGE
jgi:nascent polypeptide-associated complex subunit alpha